MQYHDRPEQRIFDATVLPCESEVPVIGDDGDDEKADDRSGHQTGQKPERETEPADEFDRADDISPEQAVMKADAFQEFGGGGFVAE